MGDQEMPMTLVATFISLQTHFIDNDIKFIMKKENFISYLVKYKSKIFTFCFLYYYDCMDFRQTILYGCVASTEKLATILFSCTSIKLWISSGGKKN